MSEFRSCKLGDLLRVEHGFAFKGEHFSDAGRHIVLTPGNFFEQGGFKPRPGKDRYYQSSYPPRYLLKKHALIVAMTEQGEGLLGSAAIVPDDYRYLHNQRIGLVRAKNGAAEPNFLFYLFNTSSVRQQIRNSSAGTKIRHTSPERMYGVDVVVPALATQQKIAAILSTYDDLIANNQRRITLLERLAEDIYRERFVRLRFPGHENVKVEKGVPQEWAVRSLGDVLELCYGKALKDEDRMPGPFNVYGSGGVVGTHNVALVVGPGLVVGRKGNVGSVFWSDGPFFPIDTAYFVRSEFSLYYLSFLLRSMSFINSDAAVPGLNRNQAYANKLLFPSGALIAQFDKVIKPCFEMKRVLGAQVNQLKATRDSLLPRLISGKLPVDALDIRFPPGMLEGGA